MPIKTLQQLCINIIYETLNTKQKSSVTVKESIRTQIVSLSLPASVISLLIEKYENTIIEKQYPVLPLRFKMFQLDYCCVTDSMPYDTITNGNGSEYSMSYIGLDNKLNYVGHYFEEYMFKNKEHMQTFTKQLMDLVEKHKTSKLPFFVYFLESIPNPILRLIYLFTYMPSVFVRSGK